MSEKDAAQEPQCERKRYCLVVCEVFYREACYCAALSPNVIDLHFISQGLHDLGSERMAATLQKELDQVDAQRFGAILLGYGLCNNGIIGLSHPSLPLVIPRAHDCITLFLGSRRRYDQYFKANPGTYFQTSGWIERDFETMDSPALAEAKSVFGSMYNWKEMVEQYGEENARFLMESMGDNLQHYTKMTYISIPQIPDGYAGQVREAAKQRGLEYHELEGDLGLLQRMLDGRWDEEDFLVVPSRHPVQASFSEAIIDYGDQSETTEGQ
jgi:hypothetical protein